MTLMNDGNFGFELDHRCFAKGELAKNWNWKSKTDRDDEQIKIKNLLVSIDNYTNMFFWEISLQVRHSSAKLLALQDLDSWI